MYYTAGKKAEAKLLIYVALSTMSLFTGLSGLGNFGVSDVPYQLIFIIEHILLLMTSLVLLKKILAIWGAVGYFSGIVDDQRLHIWSIGYRSHGFDRRCHICT